MERFEGISTRLLRDFAGRQLEAWPAAKRNFDALAGVECRRVDVGGVPFTLQHNPARIASTGARTDKASIAARRCFLCAVNRPVEQMSLMAGNEYEVLVNPFPIFPVHFTIPATAHVPQLITADGARRFGQMVEMAMQLPGMALFYNGPACGASAPDHFHFQAVERECLPLFGWITGSETVVPFRVESGLFHSAENAMLWFGRICDELAMLQENKGEPEPRMNILCSLEPEADPMAVRVIVIPRRAHRPDFYGTGTTQVLLSPASVDLAGVMVAPSPDDFNEKINDEIISSLIAQTCFPR